MTGQEILDRLSDSFKNDLQTLVKQGKVKSDGSLEEIPNAEDKKIISVDSFRFIVEVQRIDNIQTSNILKNLREIGGYSHKSAGVVDVFKYEDGTIEYVTSPDGMHRILMALICGVKEIPVNIQDVHPIGATNQDIIDTEKRFFDDKNGRSAGITETDKMRSDKLSGKMTPKQKKLDETLEKVGINVGDIGAPKETAHYSYSTISELDKVVSNNEHPCYVDLEEFGTSTIWMTNFIPKEGSNPRLHGGIAVTKSIIDNLGDPVVESMFEKWFKSTGKYTYSYYQQEWWTAKVQHTRNMENTTLRLLVAFNQWYRTKFDGDNCISIDKISSLLEVMNTETKQFIDDCLIKNMLIDYAPVVKVEEEEEDFSFLDKEFDTQTV